MIYLLTAGW